MQTHIKEAIASIVAAGAIVAMIHAGIWFTLFGTPNFDVFGFPFHYFWFVAGAPFAMMIIYWVYFRYITGRIQPEKDDMKAAAPDSAVSPPQAPQPDPEAEDINPATSGGTAAAAEGGEIDE